MVTERGTLHLMDGDGGDEPSVNLLTAEEVARILRVPTKKVYALPIRQCRLSERRIRWDEKDVYAYIARSKRCS